ncbi:M56 family metallopeptidase [Bradyrhizobium erythrophlei]|jgi:beta-lactamase regulating signal transducer with metallopeptidase domain|uniref:Signal transducer regulating beta-lactamase production, contains metallopeptidase domain n=1 Tax=Bradyrhizobium erythrophlei TaxID=1437360 RepID=A0A1M5Q2R4_9BRAD|nr:M56 family metallopeptidase [Bradyrhizobium erythrophlei]SHH08196.1 Signal transducer regulating beta-lactamase production, contains metallopeptidase domain [Bradyrhizobium erythrophlei]
MILAILADSALRSLILGSVVWIGLNLLRVRNPHVHMTSWVMVLVASLSMPLRMHWTTVSVTVDALPLPTPEALWSAASPLPEQLSPSLPSDLTMPVAARVNYAVVNWLAVATAIYVTVAGLLLLRLATGIYLTWRLVRAARPMSEPWTTDWSVRVSHVIAGPVTFGSTILLPPQCVDWDLPKRRAVLAHEGAHVANRDFYILLLASLNRAVFWFSPFAWWHLSRLAELAEIISDAFALEVLEDRLSYAEILLDLVQHVRRAPAGLEMARAGTVGARVERILATATAPAKLGWPKRIWTAAAILPVVVISAGSITYTISAVSPLAIEGAQDATTARKPQHVSFYSLDRASIFAIFREDDDVFGQLSGQRKVRLAAAGDGAYSYPAAAGQITLAIGSERQPSELTMNQNGRDLRAARIAEMSWDGIEADARLLDSYVGWYQLTPGRVLNVTRDGERLYVQETGRPKLEVKPRSADAFTGEHDDLAIFLRDGQARVTQVLLHEPVFGARLAPRVGTAKAKAIEEEFARRISEVPDRFREQTPLPGSKEAILRGIEDLRQGTPNYDRMSAALGTKIRRQAAELQAMFNALGAVESIFFRGVGPGGYDFYGVKFANGTAEFRLLLGADGKADDVIFRADGNDAAGGIVGCSEEQALKSRAGTAPIHLLFYNATGTGIQLYKLDAEGKRMAQGTIGENTSSSILTSVDDPWVVADTSGKCLEIVLPGERTRYHTVEAADGHPGHPPPRRTAPLAESEDVLRQYIEALGRGEPNYDRMTPEVATQTRQQLPFNRAILSRLGALRAVSFRGVSAMGSDIYMAHFVNGTAEWRIALVKDGAIGRIALGPQ